MFKSVRWRNERNNAIKVIFKLQFRASQVSELNVDGLVLSVVSGDVGKPTARLEKGVIKDGSFVWEYPIYERVKFTRDLKTGKINEKLCSFFVSTRLSKNGLIGEASINLATYAETSKQSIVSLPLQNSKSYMVLHVSVQRLQADFNQREVTEMEETIMHSQNKIHDSPLTNGINHNNFDEDIRLANGAANTEANVGHIEASESDMTTSSCESSSDPITPLDVGWRDNSSILPDSESFRLPKIQKSTIHKQKVNGLATTTISEEHQQTDWKSSADSHKRMKTDYSTDNCQSALTTKMFQQNSDHQINNLKEEIVALARQMDVSEMELQTLRKQILKETKRGQDLSREVTSLKDERDALKKECEKLKASQNRLDVARDKNMLQYEDEGLISFLKQELSYEKDMNANLRLQLQKTQESNAELMLAVKDLDEMLEQKNSEISNPSNKLIFCDDNVISDDDEQKALEVLVQEHTDAKETYSLKQKIVNLNNEIEIYKRDKDDLQMQMEQMALDYEILKQKNHEISYQLEQNKLQEQLQTKCLYSPSFEDTTELKSQIELLEDEIKHHSESYSVAMETINELKSHIKYLEEESEQQAQRFEADLEAITLAKIEQEQKAISAAESLRKTRLKNASLAENLQDEFRKLSMQMASTFDANEKVAVKALAEASELQMQKRHLEDMLQRANEEIQSVRESYETKLNELYNELNSKKNQTEQLSIDVENRSKQLELQKKHEEELAESLSQEIQRLKLELEKLIKDNNVLDEQAGRKENLEVEMGELKTSIKHAEELVERGNKERDELLNTISLMKVDTEKSLEELNRLRSHAEDLVERGNKERDELLNTISLMKEDTEKSVKEVNRLRSLRDEKESSMQLLQLEIETLKAQCNNLKNSLVENETEKEKLKKQVFQIKSELRRKADALTSAEKKLKGTNNREAPDGTKSTIRVSKSTPAHHSPKEVANLKEKIKLLEGQIKVKESALETSTNSFSMREKDLQGKIKELESRVEELKQNGDMIEKVIIDTNDMNNTADNSEELLNELESLKARNKAMEMELKELQGRYSEISLKFAEVEGEREQLVMMVRNLRR